MSVYHPPVGQHEAVITAALRVIEGTHYQRADDPHADAEAQYGQEQLALAARALVEAVDRLPADQQPIGWTRSEEPTAKEEQARAEAYREAARLLEEAGHQDDAVNLLYTVADGIAANAPVGAT